MAKIVASLRDLDNLEKRIPASEFEGGERPEGRYRSEWKRKNVRWPVDVGDQGEVKEWVRLRFAGETGGYFKVYEIGGGEVEYFFQGVVPPQESSGGGL